MKEVRDEILQNPIFSQVQKPWTVCNAEPTLLRLNKLMDDGAKKHVEVGSTEYRWSTRGCEWFDSLRAGQS